MPSYLFIDGAYFQEAFRETMQRYFGEVPQIDYRSLANAFGNHDKTYYYDAVDRSQVGEETKEQTDARVREKDGFHAFLNSLRDWHVREGFVSRGRRAGRRTQKAVDVQLAVDALEHAVAHNMTNATFVLGDLDFEPLLFSLNRFGIHTTVFYQPGTSSDELLEAADLRVPLTPQRFHSVTFPVFKDVNRAPSYGDTGTKPPFPSVRTGTWQEHTVEMLDGGGGYFVWAQTAQDSPRFNMCFVHCPENDQNRAERAFTLGYGGTITWSNPG